VIDKISFWVYPNYRVMNLVRFEFKRKKLHYLYFEGKGTEDYQPAVIDAFFDVMAIINAAQDERDLRNIKSLHFEKLEGKRGNLEERSIKLNDQWRLILKINRDEQGKYLLIIDIEDYH
jgi:proteic killer suppression protein